MKTDESETIGVMTKKQFWICLILAVALVLMSIRVFLLVNSMKNALEDQYLTPTVTTIGQR